MEGGGFQRGGSLKMGEVGGGWEGRGRGGGGGGSCGGRGRVCAGRSVGWLEQGDDPAVPYFFLMKNPAFSEMEAALARASAL